MKDKFDIEDQYYHEVLCNKLLEDLPGEEWEIIQGFQSYAISNHGRIKSIGRWSKTERNTLQEEPDLIKKLFFRKYYNKYLDRFFYVVNCNLSLDGLRYNRSIARLVYYHFVEKFDMDNHSVVISYKDGNSLHLNYQNLEKLSMSEKTSKAIQTNRAKNRIVEYQKSVSQYTVDGRFVKTFESINAADEVFGIGRRNILYVIQGRVFTAAGFRWFWSDYKPEKKDFLYTRKSKRATVNKLFNTSLWERLGKPPMDKNNPPACMNLSIEDLPDERWVPIPDFESQYVVSDKGRIKRLSGWTSENNIFYWEEQIVSLNLLGKVGSKNRYLYIRLNRRENRIMLIMTRLLYYCFVEPFDINNKTMVIDNQNELLWDMDISKLSLRSFSSLVNQKRKDKRNQS